MRLSDEVWSPNILYFHHSNMSQMCSPGVVARFHQWHHHSGPDRHGHPSDTQATILLCGSLQDFSVSLKTICNRREIQFTRGVEIQLFQPSIQIVIVRLREMQQSEPELFLCLFSLNLCLQFSPETSFFLFFSLQNPIPPCATICWQKQLSQLPIMWEFPLVSTMKGFRKSCQIHLFYNNGV